MSTPNERFVRKFSWPFYLLSEFLLEICSKEVTEEIFFHTFILPKMSDLGLNLGPMSNKPTHYLLDYGVCLINLKASFLFACKTLKNFPVTL